ncbi:MAG TPA: hypothetical protein VKP30_32465 [Polyangiaceae bacterium]|nr:hypothetical protein [Polyangiaceae bacterium]
MKNILRLAIGLLIPIALYSCSGDDEENSEDGTGGEQSKGGGSNTGIKATGGKSSTSSVKPSTGGTANSSGGATSKGGATQTGGVTAAAGQSSVSAAGSSPIGSVGGASTGGVQSAGGVGAFGATAGVAGAGLAGASSTVPQSCDALCGAAASCKPECMEKVFGYSSNTAVPLCLPQTDLGGTVTICENSVCGGQPGCEITAVLGTSDWTYSPAANRTTKVRLDTTIKSLTGTIAMTGLLNCSVTPVVPSAGIPLTANGTVAPQTTSPSLLGVTVQDINVDLTQLTFSSADQTCAVLANAFTSNADALTQELLSALQKRAAELKCLECDSRCAQNIACTAP